LLELSREVVIRRASNQSDIFQTYVIIYIYINVKGTGA